LATVSDVIAVPVPLVIVPIMAPLVIHHAQRLTVLRLTTDVSTVHAIVPVSAIVLAVVIAVAPLAAHAPAVAVEAVAVAVRSVAAVDVPVVVDALADKRFVIPNLNPYIINNV
jgi:hypothetical protein